MAEKKELELGDVVYKCLGNKVVYRYKIGRVTKTLAISGNVKFRKSISSTGSITVAGKNAGFSMVYHEIATKELGQRFLHYKLLGKIKAVDLKKLSLNKLSRIYEIIKEDEEN